MTLAEVEVHQGGELEPVRRSGVVVLAAPLTEIVQAQQQYHDVCLALLDDNDIQVIGKKQFKKRSAWNKLAVAFGVSTTEVRTVHERDEQGRIIRTECVVRASAPNGRTSDGIGACDLYERCCDPATCTKRTHWEDSGRPTGHVHCTLPCKQAHFSNPQHDIPATAFTRASNRAKADLFGMGEVSAEEINDNGGQRPQRASAEDIERLKALVKNLGYTADETKRVIDTTIGRSSTGWTDLAVDECAKAIEVFEGLQPEGDDGGGYGHGEEPF